MSIKRPADRGGDSRLSVSAWPLRRKVALALAKEKAKIPASQQVQLVVLPERKGLLETFLERQEEGLETALPRDLRALLRWAVLLRDGQPLTRLPFELNIH